MICRLNIINFIIGIVFAVCVEQKIYKIGSPGNSEEN